MDSCCFIDAVKGDVGDSLTPERQNNVWFIKQCLKAATDGEIDVITSTLTIAESRRAEHPPTKEVKRLFNSILTSGRVVKLTQMTQSIAEKARDLHWDHGINLGGADSLHVATALAVGCKEFFTTDGKGPLKYAVKLGSMGLRVVQPSDTALLPADYLQHRLPATTDLQD
jgi:predicted nucleic acid-binding protein